MRQEFAYEVSTASRAVLEPGDSARSRGLKAHAFCLSLAVTAQGHGEFPHLLVSTH